MAPKGDLRKLGESQIYRVAKAAGLDLHERTHPFVQRHRDDEKLFYVFYKTVENAFGDRPYLIQRIRRTERNWKTKGCEPEVKTTYQVEVFKTLAGAPKHPDQHHGRYGIKDYYRREIVKEYDIGIGEVPGQCEGTSWPFSPKSLFRYLHKYAEDPGPYHDVAFQRSTHWTLTVALDAEGGWRVASPELGFDLPSKEPDPEKLRPRPIPASKGLRLVAGEGPKGLRVGESTQADARRELGEPLEVMTYPVGTSSCSYAGGLTLFFEKTGELRTAYTRPGFLGKTDRDIEHGDPRWRVMEVMGVPAHQYADAKTWRYPGIVLTFDGFDRIAKILVYARSK